MDKRIEQLVIGVKPHKYQVEKKPIFLPQILDEILRSRQICRPFQGQVLFDVQKDIYDKFKQQLWHDLSKEVKNYNPKLTLSRAWINKMQSNAFRKVLDDAHFHSLALLAQQYPHQSEVQRHILGELVKSIKLSSKLARPHKQRFAPNIYQLLYEEALMETFIYICKNIEKYNPARSRSKKFITWVNFLLDKFILKCYRKTFCHKFQCLPLSDDFDKTLSCEESKLLSEIILQYIEKDTNNVFRQTHIKNHANANFRAIALARLSGKSWKAISSELGITIPTLSSFFQRCCQKFSPEIKRDLLN
jgi:hypothetical protein